MTPIGISGKVLFAFFLSSHIFLLGTSSAYGIEEKPRKRKVTVVNEIGRGLKATIYIRSSQGAEKEIGATNDRGVAEMTFGCPSGSRVVGKARGHFLPIPQAPECKGLEFRIQLLFIELDAFLGVGNELLTAKKYGAASVAFNEALSRSAYWSARSVGFSMTSDDQRHQWRLLTMSIKRDAMELDARGSRRSQIEQKTYQSLTDMLSDAEKIGVRKTDTTAWKHIAERYYSVKTFNAVSKRIGEEDFFVFDPVQDREVLSVEGWASVRDFQFKVKLEQTGVLNFATLRSLDQVGAGPIIRAAYEKSEKSRRPE